MEVSIIALAIVGITFLTVISAMVTSPISTSTSYLPVNADFTENATIWVADGKTLYTDFSNKVVGIQSIKME